MLRISVDEIRYAYSAFREGKTAILVIAIGIE
jgi:hypothetical protein